MNLVVRCPGSQVAAPFYLTTYSFPVLADLCLVNVLLHHGSDLSTLRSLTLKNAARLPGLRTDFRRFMQPLCTSYPQLERLTLDHALTDAPNPSVILSTANPLPLTMLAVHDVPGQVSAIVDYLQLAACTELHLATTIRGARPEGHTRNPFLYVVSPNWVAWRTPQFMEMNTVSAEVVTGRRVRMVCSYDPMGPLVPAMESTGALKATFDINFDNDRSATAKDVVLLQAFTLVSVAETVDLLKMSAVSTIRGMTDQRTEMKGVLDRKPGGRLRWFSRTQDRREWREMTL